MIQSQHVKQQAILIASSNAYDDIESVFGKKAYEVPDCVHPVTHINLVDDPTLGKKVFAFTLHVTPDNDRGMYDDRQRTEIKVFGKSINWMKGFENTKFRYQWKFKLDEDFQYTKKFCHIHQIKDDLKNSKPFVTLTAKKQLQFKVIKDVKKTIPIEEVKGHWIQVQETVKFGQDGEIQIILERLSDGKELLSYQGEVREFFGGSFMRPKWGIYRDLTYPEQLRDETILFSDISISEINMNT